MPVPRSSRININQESRLPTPCKQRCGSTRHSDIQNILCGDLTHRVEKILSIGSRRERANFNQIPKIHKNFLSFSIRLKIVTFETPKCLAISTCVLCSKTYCVINSTSSIGRVFSFLASSSFSISSIHQYRSWKSDLIAYQLSIGAKSVSSKFNFCLRHQDRRSQGVSLPFIPVLSGFQITKRISMALRIILSA